jgi:hypothetical protein
MPINIKPHVISSLVHKRFCSKLQNINIKKFDDCDSLITLSAVSSVTKEVKENLSPPSKPQLSLLEKEMLRARPQLLNSFQKNKSFILKMKKILI